MDEAKFYEPDFDPNSLKVADLRRVLHHNDIEFSNSLKKKDLVEKWNQEIKPIAANKLKILKSVVANDDGIEFVDNKKSSKKSKSSTETQATLGEPLKIEKTRKSSKKTKSEVSDEAQEEDDYNDPKEVIRRSPRKTSKSLKAEESEESAQTASPKKSKSSKPTATSNDLGKIPVLKVSPPRPRERSPRRKTSGKAKTEEIEDTEEVKPIRTRSPRRKTAAKSEEAEVETDEPEQIEPFKPRERSPRRKVSDKKESITRERSPAKKSKTKKEGEEPKEEVKPKSKSKTSKKKTENDEKEVEPELKQEEDNQPKSSPFKFGSKTAFSHDNVFQSPGHSSPESQHKKTIPRKRVSETTSSGKSPKKSTKVPRKTAFSPDPQPSKNFKSPPKKSLEISKFESSPPSNFIKNELSGTNDIFDALDQEIATGDEENFNFDNVTEQNHTPIEQLPSSIGKPSTLQANTTEIDQFETPNDGNASRFTNFSSANSTPSKSAVKRRSILPDFSKFKVSREFAKTLGITIQGEPEGLEEEPKEEGKSDEPKSPKDEDYELINAEDEEDENADESHQDETEHSINDDSVLRHLQDEIDTANQEVQDEANDAIKQIDEIFKDENTEEQTEVKSSDESHKASTFKINYSAIFGFLKQLTIFFFFTFAVISALWYREQRILIGYCGSEINEPTFPNAQNEYLIQLDDFLQTLKPTCLEAPEHAITLPRLKIKCRPDYVVYEPWYKIHGVLPISDYCVKDEEKDNIIKEVVSKTLELLRTKNANTKCGDGDDFEVGISDSELYDFFFESKSSSISDEEFEELWSRVVEDLKNEPEITLRYTGVDNSEPSEDDLSTDEDEEKTDIPKKSFILRSNSKLKLSIKCKFQKEISDNFERNKNLLIGSFIIFTLVTVAYQKFTSYQKRQSKIKEISDIILIKLQKQQKNSISDPTGLTKRYLSNIQLRDELLSNLKNSEKYSIWDSILSCIEKNSNVRSSTKEIHGEIVKVLEWIGE